MGKALYRVTERCIEVTGPTIDIDQCTVGVNLVCPAMEHIFNLLPCCVKLPIPGIQASQQDSGVMVVWVTVKDLETQLSGLLTFPRKGQGADLLEEGVHSLEVEG